MTGDARRWAGWLLVAVLALAGCASIPTDGPVTPGRSGQGDEQGGFGVLPLGPAPGETPDGIVRGFLLAAAGVENNFEVARTFLTPAAGTSWQPTTSTVVYRGSTPQLSVTDPSGATPGDAGTTVGTETATASATVQVTATVDADGRYVPSPEGTTQEVRFGLAKVSGQWRISEVADQVLITDTEFALLYRAYELYFLDPTATVLVPETRWFPDRPSTATSLVTELLAGPSRWLAGSVGTAFPAGTRLELDAVPVEAGTAQVDLTAPARGASPTQRTLMQAQLMATLGPVPTVSAVEMTVDGSVIELRGTADVLADVAVDESPVLVQDSTLVRFQNGQLVPVEDLPPVGDLLVSNPGVAYGLSAYAVLAQERSQLLPLVPGAQEVPEPLLTGADLTAPSFDRFGWIWSTPAANDGVVLAVRPEGTVARVEAGWLATRRISSLRVSRDGARVVVTSTDAAGRGLVDVAGVVRDGDGPRRLDPMEAGAPGGDLAYAEEAVWVDEVRVAVLGRREGEEVDRVHVLRLGGPAGQTLPAAPGATSVAAAKGQRTIVVGTSSGELLVQAGAVWYPVDGVSDARDPAFPG